MGKLLRQLSLLVALAAAPGCIIGTWPLPEAQRTADSGTEPLGDEACDGLDNDGDGSVDDGCPCSEARGCVGASAQGCGFGVQECIGGVLQSCGNIEGPFVPVRDSGVAVTLVTPLRLLRGDTAALHVESEPTPSCPAIVVPAVAVTLEAQQPVMRVRALARDDGSGADAVRGDGIYSVELPNPFGPGVPAQPLRLDVQAVLDDIDVHGEASVPLEDP